MAKADEEAKTAVPLNVVQVTDLALAKTAVGRVFTLLGIKTVVIVDDELDAAPEVGDLIARYRIYLKEAPERIETIKELESVARSDDEADVRQDLQELWDRLTEEQRERILLRMDWISGRKTFQALNELLADHNPTFISLSQWKDRELELTAPEVLPKSLFLFDLDMRKEGGAIDEGMRIIKSLLIRFGASCYCGLLSHRIAKDAEFQDWKEYTKAHQLEPHRDRFVVISKKHVPDAPMVFVKRVKRAAISSLCYELRRDVEYVLNDAVGAARREIAELNVYDFEEIVFQSSYIEGTWEPDTVLRILALYTQREARKLLKANVALEEKASRIRSVVDIVYRPTDAPTSSSRRIMRLENYEDGEFLRDHHIPLDLGDIFQTRSGVDEFVVLAQPCDIMCRNEQTGKRPEEVLVAPIIKRVAKDKSLDKAPAYWKLDSYSTDGVTEAYADFHGVRSIPVLALDLAVFDSYGTATFRLGQNCPSNVIPAWKLRYAAVAEEVGRILKRYEGSGGAEPDKAQGEAVRLIADALTTSVRGFATGSIDLTTRTLSYDLERISRLKAPRAASLLRAYTAYVARDGNDHDLTNILKKPK
ncbi:MAG TPA: hypothetical protein VEA69_08655 [Tepidisphaeraceae bacterium]|nr:hypothetical protein [Tepidisphaeraceae bacterium]